MHHWHYIPEHPISLTLSADARLGATDYLNDHTWELKLGSSDSSSISLETTFGLRARLCRIFPSFIHSGQVINDPAQFAHPITIHQYFPNYIELSFKPFSNVNVKIEYWVPDSNTIAGRVLITNTGHSECPFQTEWSEILNSSPDGSRMSINEVGMTTLLSGKTSDLFPVLYLTGGAQAGKSPYPSLSLSLTIPAHGETISRWVHASFADMNASYDHAKAILSKNWDALFARINRVNSKSLEIHTGNKDWDTAFIYSQNLAYKLILHPAMECKFPSYVNTRKPDQGHSLRTDGSDYNHQWNGQTPLDAYYLANILLPSSPDLVRGFIENFVESQNQNGEIDFKPGLSGQRSHILATPILCFLTLQLYEITRDFEFLSSIFPKLHSFFLSWFSPAHDHDSDQIPEWEQVYQTNFEDSPLFSADFPGSFGVDISTVESPTLCSFLYQECKALIKMAKILNRIDVGYQLRGNLDMLKSMVDQSWSDDYACYLYRDRDSHLSSEGETLGTFRGSGTLEIHREFEQPIRPIIYIETTEEITHASNFFIHGNGASGTHRVENITANRIHWQHTLGCVTSEFTYSLIERVEINGVSLNESVTLSTVNLKFVDQPLLLPIWASIPTKQKAKILINLTIMNKKKFLGQHGLRSNIHIQELGGRYDDYFGNNLPWTAMILNGMINYDGRNKAAELFMRLMKPIVNSIQTEMTLYQSYHSETGKPLGIQNSLTSLVPINVFLNIAGIKIINPFHVEIAGFNPFPWPVTIKYRGLTVIKHEKKTLIVFPDGYNTTVQNEKIQVIKREPSDSYRII